MADNKFTCADGESVDIAIRELINRYNTVECLHIFQYGEFNLVTVSTNRPSIVLHYNVYCSLKSLVFSSLVS